MGIDHAAIVVRNLERALRFYRDVMGFRVVLDKEAGGPALSAGHGREGVRARIVLLEVPGGRTRLELLHYRSHEGTPLPSDNQPYDEGLRHISFLVTDLDRAYTMLRSKGVQFISAPAQPQTPAALGGRFYYFRDPDGVILEIEESPSAKYRRRTEEVPP